MCVGSEVVETYVGKKCLSTIFCQFWSWISGFNGQWGNHVGSCGLRVLWVMSWAGWAPFFTPWYVYCVEWRLMDDEIEKTYFPAIFLIFWSVSSHLNVWLFLLKDGRRKRFEKRECISGIPWVQGTNRFFSTAIQTKDIGLQSNSPWKMNRKSTTHIHQEKNEMRQLFLKHWERQRCRYSFVTFLGLK